MWILPRVDKIKIVMLYGSLDRLILEIQHQRIRQINDNNVFIPFQNGGISYKSYVV